MRSTVLVVTSLEDVTSDQVIDVLNKRGSSVVRVDPADIGRGLSFEAHIDAASGEWSGRLCTPTRSVRLEEIRAVYYRRPTPYANRFAHLSKQQQAFATAEAKHGLGGVLANLPTARYVNHPQAVTAADFKPTQLRIAAQLGFAIPRTLITNEVQAAGEFAREHGPVIYKTFRGLPLSEDGTTGAIWTQRVAPSSFDSSLSVTAHLFQKEIPKSGDVRVTVVGRRAFATRITAPHDELDWRRGHWDELTHVAVRLPPSIETALFHYLAAFDLVFGCFDFALTGPADDPGHWIWIECNPNGQWGWLPEATDIAEAFADVLMEKETGGEHVTR
ncbi:ATP-grasp ribosomal peptide maturase [Streptomyces avicenniae]|uniref:ATP-grasp ribosomal peptide maturase n=1 Tax=Streptomyces avicenniae TaxID=500153 RepID=UPI000699ADD7|nr:ATP-grasp ribosomal peptide maturase [Streptomyces avicenniae]